MLRGTGRPFLFFCCPLILFLALLATAGCGKAVGDVTGTITYKKKPLPFGTVMLLGSDGLFRNVKIEPGGTYAFSAVPVGEAKFTVSCVDPKIEEATKALLGKGKAAADAKLKMPMSVGPGQDPLAKYYLIPREYEDVTKGKLILQVEAGSNTYNIDLK